MNPDFLKGVRPWTSSTTAFAEPAANTLAEPPTRPLLPAEQILHSTVLVECRNAAGMISTGTAFGFNLFANNASGSAVLVTNKHVIRGATEGILRFTARRGSESIPDIGSNLKLTVTDQFQEAWIEHSDPEVDLAVFPLTDAVNKAFKNSVKQPFIVTLTPELIPTEDGLRDLSPVEELLIAGYPDGISDHINNIPVLRRGITATPAYIKFANRTEFLIDAAIFPGSSGSPVFLFNQGTFATRSGSVHAGTRILLVGVVYATTLHTREGELKIVPAPTNRIAPVTSIPNNIGVCINASRILDFEPILASKGVQVPIGYPMRSQFRP